jgi:uncharacterized membrane protein (UPF0127 family)
MLSRGDSLNRRSARGGSRAAALVALLTWTAAPACSASETRPAPAERDMRRASVETPGGRKFVAEIADTPERWMHGYMFRQEIGEDEGMIFVFPEAGFHPFWMKNTLVPLDMIWMDDTFTAIYIQESAPPCRSDPCPSYGPVRKARYVLEVRGGTAARERLRIGDRLRVSFPQPAD